jgi:hypothetical protein
MPKFETNSSTIGSKFVRKRFEGDKTQFQQFEAEIITALLSEIGEYGVKYLTTEWPVDPDTSAVIMDHRYTMLPILAPLGIDEGTSAERRERREMIAYTDKLNDKIESCRRVCTKILCDRVSSALTQHLILLHGDAYLFWRYLKRTYGDHMITAQGIGSIFLNFIATTMEDDERFNEFILEFDR